jgi:hypothetical protein
MIGKSQPTSIWFYVVLILVCGAIVASNYFGKGATMRVGDPLARRKIRRWLIVVAVLIMALGLSEVAVRLGATRQAMVPLFVGLLAALFVSMGFMIREMAQSKHSDTLPPPKQR